MSRRARAEKERMGQRATGRSDRERVSERAREGGGQGTHRAGAQRARAKYGDLGRPCTRFRARDPVRVYGEKGVRAKSSKKLNRRN